MIRRVAFLAAVALLGAAIAPVSGGGLPPAETNEPPLADAGLDQQTTLGATVYLDASGSVDPDGSIEAYQWQVVRPDGTTAVPAPSTGVTTSYSPRQSGRYVVTVEVIDDSGASATDTLYIDVSDAGPRVTLSGPVTASPGTAVTYHADLRGDGADLQTVAWYHDGTRINETHLSGDSVTCTQSFTFSAVGNHTVSAIVTDAAGRADEDDLMSRVESPLGAGGTVRSSGDGVRADSVLASPGESTITLVHTSGADSKNLVTDSYYNMMKGWPNTTVTQQGNLKLSEKSSKAQELLSMTEGGSVGGRTAKDGIRPIGKSQKTPDGNGGSETGQLDNNTDNNIYTLPDSVAQIIAGGGSSPSRDGGNSDPSWTDFTSGLIGFY